MSIAGTDRASTQPSGSSATGAMSSASSPSIALSVGGGPVSPSCPAELSSSLQITLRAFSMSMESGDYEQALDLSELLESIDPDQQEHALALRLQALIGLDREEEVFTALMALIDALPDQSELSQYIAQTLGRTADPGRWLAVTERVADHFNGNAWAQLSAGWLAYRAGQAG